MKIYISNFYNIRFFTPNMILISTTGGTGGPLWYIGGNRLDPFCYLDKNNVMNGIRFKELSFNANEFEALDEQCSRDCPFIHKAPHCQFMDMYREQLRKLDFKALFHRFEDVAAKVKEISHYDDEPIIVLMVYEKADCPCAERPCLQEVFQEHGYELKEWTKDLLNNNCIF